MVLDRRPHPFAKLEVIQVAITGFTYVLEDLLKIVIVDKAAASTKKRKYVFRTNIAIAVNVKIQKGFAHGDPSPGEQASQVDFESSKLIANEFLSFLFQGIFIFTLLSGEFIFVEIQVALIDWILIEL